MTAVLKHAAIGAGILAYGVLFGVGCVAGYAWAVSAFPIPGLCP